MDFIDICYCWISDENNPRDKTHIIEINRDWISNDTHLFKRKTS